MSRMHTRKRGKSRSHKVGIYDPSKFTFIDQNEVIEAAVGMKKENVPNSVVGLRLRDQFGVPGTKYVFKKKLSKLLAENGVTPGFPEDLLNLIERYKSAAKHTNSNPKDKANLRKQGLIMSKILRLLKYYRRNGRIPENWSLDKAL